MKTPAAFLLLASFLVASCGKEEEAKTPAKAPAAAAKKPEPAKPKPPEKKVPIVAPQGKLPQMDPEKAKFIAVPSTPPDAEAKKAEPPKDEVKKAEAPQAEIKKVAPKDEARKVEIPRAEVKKAEVPVEVKEAGGSALGDAGKSQ